VSRADQILVQGAREILGRDLTDPELESFQKYRELMIKWQRVQRLIGSVDPVWISESLLIDSLLFLRVLPPDVRSIADLGSGAGLPGIPLKIVRPEIDITLIESRERRASFLSTVVRELHLERIWVANSRGEDLVRESSERFGAVVMRCAGNPGELLPLAARLTSRGGMVVATGPPEPQELPIGRWVEVAGAGGIRTRRFAVLVS
jgi:16S rRNA (guanine527-N7)-methyltransferase